MWAFLLTRLSECGWVSKEGGRREGGNAKDEMQRSGLSVSQQLPPRNSQDSHMQVSAVAAVALCLDRVMHTGSGHANHR